MLQAVRRFSTLTFSLQVNSLLLKETEYSSSASNQSMLVTCIEDCPDVESCKVWKKILLILRKAIQNAIDETSGIDYRDEIICPGCVVRKEIGELGTWSYSKIRTALYDCESTIRCRHGHSIDIKLVKGLVQCQMDEPDAAETIQYQPSPALASTAPEGENQVSSSCGEAEKETLLIANDQRIRSMPESLLSGPLTRAVCEDKEDFSTEDDIILSKVKKTIEECEAVMKKRFFGRRKLHLALDNLGIKESEVPLADLDQTPLGVSLHSMSLSCNRLESIPPQLTLCLPNLKSLDLSRCYIYDLPKKWNLPKLKKLNLSQNLLISFPSEVRD